MIIIMIVNSIHLYRKITATMIANPSLKKVMIIKDSIIIQKIFTRMMIKTKMITKKRKWKIEIQPKPIRTKQKITKINKKI